MLNPEISIVIPVFSKTWELSDAIESILSQTYQDYEVILVDNNAKEKSRFICQEYTKRYPEKIRMIHEPVQGVCSARNAGIFHSRGKFIATHDEDDLMKPNRLEVQRDLLLKRPEVSLVTAGYDIISPDGKNILKKNVFRPTDATPRSFGFIEKAVISLFQSCRPDHYARSFHFHMPSAFMFRKETALKIGLFDIRFNPQFLEDYDFQVRIFKEGPFAQVPESLFFYRESLWKLENESFDQIPSKYQVRSDWHQSDQVFFISLWKQFSGISPKNIPILKKVRAVILCTVGLHAIRFKGGESIGAILLRRSLFAKPEWHTFKLYLKTYLPHDFYPRFFWFNKFDPGSLEKIPKDFPHAFMAWDTILNSTRKIEHPNV